MDTKFLRDNYDLIKNVGKDDKNLLTNLALYQERGRVKKEMSQIAIGDYFVTKSNRLNKVIAIGPVVKIEDVYYQDEEEELRSGEVQIIVFKDMLSNRLWSYSLDRDDSQLPVGISTDLSVHEYQVVNDSINNGYKVDIPLAGSNPVNLSNLISDGVYLAKVGKTIKTVMREQYGESYEA